MNEFTPDASIMAPYYYERAAKGSTTGESELVRSYRRRSVYFDKTFGLRMDVVDGGGEYLRSLAQSFPAEFDRALKSIGYQLRIKMLTALRQGGSRSAKWAAVSGIRDKEDSSVKKGIVLRKTRSRTFYGKMGTARGDGKAGASPIAYVVDKAGHKVTVGWMGFEARKLATKLQQGFDMPVTTAMRKHFFGSGIGLDKGSIHVPGRPLIQPVWDDEGRDLLRKFELRIHAYVRGYSGKSATKYVRENL